MADEEDEVDDEESDELLGLPLELEEVEEDVEFPAGVVELVPFR